jgi:hypothetical protein
LTPFVLLPPPIRGRKKRKCVYNPLSFGHPPDRGRKKRKFIFYLKKRMLKENIVGKNR